MMCGVDGLFLQGEGLSGCYFVAVSFGMVSHYANIISLVSRSREDDEQFERIRGLGVVGSHMRGVIF